MATLNWTFFDGKLFQKFCNTLLLFEVSKFAHVFTAEGKDGGVDQYFHGEYGGRNGKWRFQDKFHNSGNKTSDIAALKRDVVQDIQANYSGEQFIVLITNVNLSPAKYNEIVKAAMLEMASKTIADCEFFLWHEANIEALLPHYPLIFHWYWNKETVLLQLFEDYFAKPLDSSSFDVRYQFNNAFYGREKKIESLTNFLTLETESSLAIVANGGYGKTRLVIELLKNHISADAEWIPLVISPVGFNSNQVYRLLQTPKKLLLFIDNAHEVPDVVKEVKLLVDNSLGKDKLLLTTRPTLFSDIFYKLPSYSRDIQKLLLEPLDYDTTKTMLASELPHLQSKNVIHLATISKGVPNVILELVRMVRSGKHPNELSGEESFQQSVQEIFAEVSKEIEAKLGIDHSKFDDFVRLISLISPVQVSTENLQFIADFLGIRVDKLELLIGKLTELNLLAASPSLAIKPDPYSDTILLQTINKNKAFIEHIQKTSGAEKYLENILKNLSEAEIDDSHKEAFIDELLSRYIRLVEEKNTPATTIKSISEFVEKIVVKKSWAALYVIEQFFRLNDNPKHSIHEFASGWSTKSYIGEVQDIVVKIFYGLSSYTSYFKDNSEKAYDLVRRYIKTTSSLNVLSTCYMYREWDFQHYNFHPRICCEKQAYLADKILPYLKGTDEDDIAVALYSMKLLLELEFKLEEYYEPETMAFHYGTGHVPYCDHVKQIRKRTLQGLIGFYMHSPRIANYRDEVLSELLDYIFYASKNRSKRYPHDLSEELPIVFAALEEILNGNPSTIVKNAILLKLRTFARVEYEDRYKPAINKLVEQASSTTSLYEELELHLRNSDYFDVKDKLADKLLKTIAKYADFDTFANDLINIRVHNESVAYNFQVISSIVGKHYPTDSRILFAFIQERHLQLIPEAIALITYQYKDREYFAAIIKWMWDKREQFFGSFFWLITSGRGNDITYFEHSDLEYFEYAIDGENKEADHYISYNLFRYAYIDKEKTFNLLDRFIKRLEKKEVDTITYVLFENNEKYKEDFKLELRHLYLSNLDKIDLSDIAHGFFQFLEKEFGFEELLDCLVKLMEIDLRIDKYRLHRDSRPLYRNTTLNEQQKIERYLEVLEWSIDHPMLDEEIKAFIVAFFRPNYNLTEETKNTISAQIDHYSGNKDQLLALSKAVKAFNQASEQWIKLTAEIADEVCKIDKTTDVEEVFGGSYCSNLGSKSKSGVNIPYQEDVVKKNQLENVLAGNTFSFRVASYLGKCLDKVNADIKREIENDKSESSW
ncbi:MAG: hypothetical protein JWQ09_3425 [Segetibacter sp.]|nr:hypothetical protein [Segetibacter sp.]